MNWITKFDKNPLIFSCVKAPLKEVQKLLALIVNDNFGDRWIVKENEKIDLEYLRAFVNESHLKVVKYLIWQSDMDKSYTIFLSNLPDGWITLMSNYSLKNNHEIFMASFSQPTTDYPLYRFHYQLGGKKRIVQVMKDTDKWHFYTEGEPLKIENLSFYSKSRIADRFNNDLLEQYMNSLGFVCSNKSFWKSNAAIECKLATSTVSP